jgi:hypothetical protein
MDHWHKTFKQIYINSAKIEALFSNSTTQEHGNPKKENRQKVADIVLDLQNLIKELTVIPFEIEKEKPKKAT